MYTITKQTLEQALTTRINSSEAELTALKAVTINTTHKTLTNRAIENGKIGDYLSIGKALSVYYNSDNHYQSLQVTAYTYNNEDGTEIGANGIMRISRTMTPTELQKVVSGIITEREKSLKAIKLDLVNAGSIVKKYNHLAEQINELTESLTWASRAVIK